MPRYYFWAHPTFWGKTGFVKPNYVCGKGNIQSASIGFYSLGAWCTQFFHVALHYFSELLNIQSSHQMYCDTMIWSATHPLWKGNACNWSLFDLFHPLHPHQLGKCCTEEKRFSWQWKEPLQWNRPARLQCALKWAQSWTQMGLVLHWELKCAQSCSENGPYLCSGWHLHRFCSVQYFSTFAPCAQYLSIAHRMPVGPKSWLMRIGEKIIDCISHMRLSWGPNTLLYMEIFTLELTLTAHSNYGAWLCILRT